MQLASRSLSLNNESVMGFRIECDVEAAIIMQVRRKCQARKLPGGFRRTITSKMPNSRKIPSESSAFKDCRKTSRLTRVLPYYWSGCFRWFGSFAAGFAGVATVFGLVSTGITVAFTLLFDSGVTGAVVVGLGSVLLVVLVVSAVASAAFSSASVAALVSCASSSRAAAFLSPAGVSSSAVCATWKLIKVPNRGLKPL